MSSHRDCIAKEILSTESFYVESLRTVIEVFIEPLRLLIKKHKPIINDELLTMIFANIELIVNVNEELLAELEDKIGNDWSEDQCIGETFIKMVPFLKSYSQYCNSFDVANQTLQETINNNSKFKRFVKKGNKNQKCKNIDLESFLIMPVQRVPRYVLLLKDLVKYTDPSHPDYNNLQEALTSVQKVATAINVSVSIFQKKARLISIEQELNLHIGLIQPSREVLYEVNLMRINVRKPHVIKLYVLNDMLIIATDGKYVDRCSLHFVWVIDVDDDCAFELKLPFCFKDNSVTVAAQNEEEKATWMNNINEAIEDLISKQPKLLVKRGKAEQKFKQKEETIAQMSPQERRKQLREERKQAKKRKLVRDDSKFNTIRFD